MKCKYLLLLMIQTFVAGTDPENVFALDLFKQVYTKEPRNFAISPPVIRSTLSLLYQVSHKDVGIELQQVLQLPHDKADAAVELKSSLAEIFQKRDNFRATCTVYHDSNELSAKFFSLFTGYFKPEVETTSGSDVSPIIAVLPKIADMPNYDLLVASEFSLAAGWRHKFNPSDTESNVFHFLNGFWPVSLMRQTARFGIVKVGQLVALELQYTWETELSMIFVMPSDEDALLSELVQAFDMDSYRAIDVGLTQRIVDVVVPRFSVASDVALGATLAKMGVVTAFTGNAFDLYRYRGSGVGPITQTGTVSVLEGGTNDAEATAKSPPPAALLPVFHANRPFMYLVRNTKSKEILIVGHYSYY